MAEYLGPFPPMPAGVLFALMIRGPRVVTELRGDLDVDAERIRRWLKRWERAGLVESLAAPRVTSTKLWMITDAGRRQARAIAAAASERSSD